MPRSLDGYPEVMGKTDVAELLGLSTTYVSRLCSQGRLPAHQLAGTRNYKFMRDELIAWLKSDENRVQPS